MKKMSVAEVLKRCEETAFIHYSRHKYRDPNKWPYWKFAGEINSLAFHDLADIPVEEIEGNHYLIYNYSFELSSTPNWFFSDKPDTFWPSCHYSKINYRPGNPYGDVRINWELNRLQILPSLALLDENRANEILTDWLSRNPYLHGPAYLSSMEVALRWISVYRTICLFKKPIDKLLLQNIIGLAIASGNFIENRLSTHSSAGNHLIVEAVGLFWIGKALGKASQGPYWSDKARKILWDQVRRQVHPDGSSIEQSFWYLGFVIDALLHYLMLEEREKIPEDVKDRIEQSLDFVSEVILPDGSFPDFGDRDDGCVSRYHGDPSKKRFLNLLSIGCCYFDRHDWLLNVNKDECFCKSVRDTPGQSIQQSDEKQVSFKDKSYVNSYHDAGITALRRGKGRLFFRHAPLGMPPTYGHGHADALSILFYWDNIPVLIDLGSGQYNANQDIRDYFRSTIAHNTVEICGKSQADMLGPFMWDKSYTAQMVSSSLSPVLMAEARHDGYLEKYSIQHYRKIVWRDNKHIEIHDEFIGQADLGMRGGFHLDPACLGVKCKENKIIADFGRFDFIISFPGDFDVQVYHGSCDPFMGWKSTIYGQWEPIYSVVFNSRIAGDYKYKIDFFVKENV